MLFLASGSMPAKSLGDFYKLSVETLTNNPYPDFIKRTYMFSPEVTSEGFICHALFDIEKGKEEEGLLDISNRIAMFAMSIEGYKSTLKPVLSLEQAFTNANKLGLV